MVIVTVSMPNQAVHRKRRKRRSNDFRRRAEKVGRELSSKISLEQYIKKKLGENENPLAQLKHMFVLSFTAYSFTQFWQYWNPVYGYYLYYYCFRPLRERLKLPYAISVLLTFVISGFLLHDLPSGWIIRQAKKEGIAIPFVALWFFLIAVLLLLTKLFKLEYRKFPAFVRININSLSVVIPGIIAYFIV